MVILFVIDNYLNQTNGTTITTKRFAENLRTRGHEVRVLSAGKLDEPWFYGLKERYMPIVTYVAKKQDVIFSKPNKKIIEKAIEGVDVVHFVTPFKTSKAVLKIAEKKGIAVTGSFHIQPENITYGMGLGKLGKPVAYYIYQRFRKFYARLSHTHCPSKFIAGELKRHAYPTQTKVISNGVSDVFFNQEINEAKDKFHIISIGRYAKEKRQDILLKAVSKSRYKDDIRITLAGHGPRASYLKKLAKRLNLEVTFCFLNQQQLIYTLKTAHLYVHPADIEIEAISCLEAIAVGLVPVISNAKRSATPQFALDERNLFKQGSAESLKEKIEYWIENPQERQAVKEAYRDFSQKYRLDYSIDRFEEMIIDAYNKKKQSKIARSLKGKVFRKELIHHPVRRTISGVTYYLIAIPLLYLYTKFILNVKYKNTENFKNIKGGAVLISNHVHTMDSVMNALAAFPKKTIFTAIKDNFKRPVAGIFVRLLGAVPIPDNILENHIFFYEMTNLAKSGRFIHFFPEGQLVHHDENIRSFKRGAFKIAVDSSVPIVPIRILFKQKKTILNRNKQQIILDVGKPIFPDMSISSKDALEKIKLEAENYMNQIN